MERVFTFGHGHTNPKTGKDLFNHYVVINANTAEQCRMKMLNHFGGQWAFEYRTCEAAGVERWGMRELPRKEWPASSKQYVIRDGVCVHVGD
jgi:hypothetical protein